MEATPSGDTLPVGKREEDSSESLSLSHEADPHGNWFREQVGAAIAEAESPEAQWVSNEEANRRWAEKRAELEKRLTRRRGPNPA